MDERAHIIVQGVVQGVGFRPYVYALARDLGLKGFVTNTSHGVFIDIEGKRIDEFLKRLPNEAPVLASIKDITIQHQPLFGYTDFTIRKSIDDASAFTLVSPDVSICNDCLREMFDPADRRYLYPFINCTNCGPRYSITRSIPYDRPNTTMAEFTMCPSCRREYEDPHDRRFHAQPNACPACGPMVEFKIQGSKFNVKGDGSIKAAIDLLKRGGIVAIKGIGGFHIACDATNDEAVRRLRERKRKSNKPFAVMLPSVRAATMFGHISPQEEALLLSSRRPIVLVKKRRESGITLSDSVAPHNRDIGCMLPYTPLHYLLFYYPIDDRVLWPDSPNFDALVMTSGNLSEEPIMKDNEEAMRRLFGIVDGFLLHNRDIFMRVDDSVLRMRNTDSELSFIRRSRGYSPEPILLRDDGPEVLGCGADLKNTFTLTKGGYAILSQHIGDMENYETLKFFEETLENLKKVYRVSPAVVAHDLHPEYISTKWAKDQWSGHGSQKQTPVLYGIQHHYAHIGSVMAEYGLCGPVVGVAFDGTGYGTDGNLWGGEFLIAEIDGFERIGQFKYIPLPGGDAAIKEGWRTAVSFLVDAREERVWEYMERSGLVHRYGRTRIEQVMRIRQNQELSPLSSGCGRLFDAVSALLGICDTNTFEGEAAMALESCTEEGIEAEYQVEFRRENGYTVLDFSGTIREIIDDLSRDQDIRLISTGFHNTVASAIRYVVSDACRDRGIFDVVLSGGTFQNLYLLNRTVELLKREGLNVYINRKVPANDAGISLGQAYIVRERLKVGKA